VPQATDPTYLLISPPPFRPRIVESRLALN
jgi:hypothetical protein